MTTTTSQVSLPTLLPLCFMVFAAFVTVDRAVSAGLKRVLLASHDRYLRVYQPEPAATSVVVGDSRAGAHFPHSAHDQPQAFFNLGQGGMGLPMSGALLRDYIDTHGKPSQVIIETSFLADDGSGIAVAGLAQIYSTRVRHLVRQDDPASARISTWFHTLQFNHHRLIPALVGLFRERKSRIYRGHISREVIEEVNAWEPFRLEIPERNAQVLTDMVASLKAHNIEVVMVMTPLLPERIRKITNLGAFLDGVQALAEATGARFVNFIDHVREHRYFADSLHLNAQGRAIFLRDFWRQVGSPRSGHTPTYPTESRPPLPQWGVQPTHLHVP